MIEATDYAIAGSSVAVPSDRSSYPGGKSGSGIFQRLVNLIPRHRVLISAFAGQCGVVRNIKPAEHTIVIDSDASVCQWWDDWRRTPKGRTLEIHHCDSIEWLRFRFGTTKYFAAGSAVGRSSGGGRENLRSVMNAVCDRQSRNAASPAGDAISGGTAATRSESAEAFVFADPPYVISERASGKIYSYELSDIDHLRLIDVVTSITAASAAAVMICGYATRLYAAWDPWRSIDHRVPTRGGLQAERIWMNYDRPAALHDYRYIGKCRRSRERIRRRQKTWLSQLAAMGDRERAAMLEALGEAVK